MTCYERIDLETISYISFCVFIDVHTLHRRCAATQGTLFPKNIQFLMVDDVLVYYYVSGLKESSIPKWLKHLEGVLLWDEIRSNLKYNRFIMDTAIKMTSKRFNHSHGKVVELCLSVRQFSLGFCSECWHIHSRGIICISWHYCFFFLWELFCPFNWLNLDQ